MWTYSSLFSSGEEEEEDNPNDNNENNTSSHKELKNPGREHVNEGQDNEREDLQIPSYPFISLSTSPNPLTKLEDDNLLSYPPDPKDALSRPSTLKTSVLSIIGTEFCERLAYYNTTPSN